MIEILVSLIILSVGILGMLSLQMYSMQSSQSADARTQIVLTVNDLVEKMKADGQSGQTYCATAAGSPFVLWRTGLLNSVPAATAATIDCTGDPSITVTWTNNNSLMKASGPTTLNVALAL
ncbi:type IV pilus modification protein PilV [Parendozoicomonas haliclonae]|uniref:Type IV pilus modification protein PilV n=2 Tax=Parendozoicomonas haliclonae TaxID=1960125 RepID=A0A1X7APY0_9GAMM|nr:hypothetical protein EHSB41UT_04178 [Parendozoicomonas haliclonae]